MAAAAIGAGVLPSTAPAQTRSRGGRPIVETTHGRVRGEWRQSVAVFKGIPYGASTAGGGRFRRPTETEPWTGIRDALELGHRSPQFQNAVVPEFGIMNLTEPSGEDCLCLNIWTAALGDDERRPVMVWLHGGAYMAGSGGWTCYDGTRLAARHGAVLVTLNHRLNVFGYLHLAELGQPRFAEASNLGMLDIVLALEWVQRNIERFGGDPDSVTVFGQSGGASKVSTLLAMPAARGLFHKAIVQSGSQVTGLSHDEARDTAQRYLDTLGLSTKTAERILSLPYDELRDAIPKGRFALAPLVDGTTLPAHPFDPVASAVAANVPLLIGSTETEVTWDTATQYDPLEGADLVRQVSRKLGCSAPAAASLIDVYRRRRPHADGLDLYFMIATDASAFRRGPDIQAERRAALAAAPVFKYYFEWYSPVRQGRLRAMHTMDIPFVFDNLELARSLTGDPAPAQPLADRMAAAWVAFARSGDPNHAALPRWPAFDAEHESTMVLNRECRVVEHLHAEERAALAAIADA